MTQTCENEGCATPTEKANKKIGGHKFCAPCATAIREAIMQRGGVGKWNTRQAIIRSNFGGKE